MSQYERPKFFPIGYFTKDGAKMLMAQAGSEVPKFTVITSAVFRAGYYGHVRPRRTFTWA